MITSLLNGDWRFFWPNVVPTLCHTPSSWDSSLNTGFGIPDANTLWITSYLNLSSCAAHLGLSWNLISIFFWILPELLIAFAAAYYLFTRYISPQRLYGLLAAIIYTTNTYFLLIFTGGQVGFALAYACIPLVYIFAIKLLQQPNLRQVAVLGLALGLQLWWDIRVVYLTVGSFILLIPFVIAKKNDKRKRLIYFASAFIIVALLHSFWILPSYFGHSVGVPQGFFDSSNVYYFSFADFSHAFALLHPNWPENIFGKTYFLQPEFLLLPVFAFLFLLTKQPLKTKNIQLLLFFALLSIVSTFLAKGTSDPFGVVYVALFAHFPGFVMFRDPTKFYSLISISYSMLIPASLLIVDKWIEKKIPVKKVRSLVVPLVFVLIWIVILRQSYIPIEKLFTIHVMPSEYQTLANILSHDKTFSRTLWVPNIQRYRYLSDTHPTAPLPELSTLLYGKPNMPINKIITRQNMQEFSIKYIIVPEDSEKEIFLKDNRYSEQKRIQTIAMLTKITWLKRLSQFKNLAVFEVSSSHDHFWSESKSLQMSGSFINTTTYTVSVKNAKKRDVIVFSETFDPYWRAEIVSRNIRLVSVRYQGMLNSFVLPEDGNYTLKVFYEPQAWVDVGTVVSLITGGIALALIFVLHLRKNQYRKKRLSKQ